MSYPSQQRWKIPAVLMVTMFIGYLDRMNISLALPLIAEQMHWDLEQKQFYGGLLMSLFYLAYGCSNIFLSPLAAQIGPRRSLMIIIILWSIFTSLGAFFSQVLLVFAACRILLGLAEGTHVPMMSQLTRNWFAAHERSRATGIWMGGLFLAIVAGPIILVPIMHKWGWQSGFHVLAVAGLVLSLPLVYLFIFNHPASKASSSNNDSNDTVETSLNKADNNKAFWQVVKSPAYIAAQLGGIFNNMLAVGISSWLPSFLSSRDDVSYEDLSYLSALPYVFSLVGLFIWSWLGDKHSRRARNSAIGFVCAGSTLFFAFNQESLFITLAAFSVGVFFISSYSACEHPMIQHLFPENLVARGSGLFNGVAMIIGGSSGSFMIGKIMADSGTQVNVWPLMLLFLAAGLASMILHNKTRY